jgi:NADP-dependent 3-hydroxy acid dehydrogenase YdfG
MAGIEGNNIRVTIISPGSTQSEVADSITDETAKERMKSFGSVGEFHENMNH